MSSPMTPSSAGKSRPVVLVFSVLAALQVVTGGAALSDALGKDTAGLIVLVISAVQVGMTFYVQNQVVPFEDTAAYVDTEGNTVAGPASPPTMTNGEPVVVQDPGEI